ncbi:MAG: MFS transporter, partial [Myxococcota bacterium]
YDQLGAPAAFGVMAGLLALATAPVWWMVEPPRVAAERVGWRAMVAAIPSIGLGWWAVLATYKAGEASASAMVKALLVDAGWSPSELGWVLGLGGSAAGLGGALLGGWTAGRVDRGRALVGFGAVQALAIALLVVPASFGASRLAAVVVVGIEHWTSGMATATLFAAMMDRCRPGHEATDYTLQACAVVFATGAAGATSGVVAGAFGYLGHFAIATGLAAVGVAVAAWGARR